MAAWTPNQCRACGAKIVWAIESFHRERLALDAHNTTIKDSVGWYHWDDLTNLAGDSERICWPATKVGSRGHRLHNQTCITKGS